MLLACSGWRVIGSFPDLPRLVLIGAPHSSWWDAAVGFLIALAVGLRIRWMAKSELFVFPLGHIARACGGIAVDRSGQRRNQADAAAELLTTVERRWLVLLPDGTRHPIRQWRRGFWRIAVQAKVPIFPVAFDYPSRQVILGPLHWPSGDQDADVAALARFYLPWHGKGGKPAVPEEERALLDRHDGPPHMAAEAATVSARR